jgi:hypothetical protein
VINQFTLGFRVPILVLSKCRACSTFRDPREFVGGVIVGVCWQCYERHQEALELLAGDPPKGCQVCLRTVADLEALSQREGQADTRLVLERKDGIYQVLCLACDEKYQAARRDLYAKTPHGWQQKL